MGNILNGLEKVQRFAVLTANLQGISRNGLALVRRYISGIRFLEVSNDFNLDDLFGRNAEKLGMLNVIEIRYHHLPSAHHLTKSNFSALAGIREISLTHCGIRSIAADTFDTISDTLLNLYLYYNQMFTLPATVFNRLIDKRTSSAAFIKVFDNPYDCDCEFFQAIGQLMVSSFMMAHFYAVLPCMHTASMPHECRTHLQVMHTAKFNLTGLPDGQMVHAKFLLKIDVERRALTIRTLVSDRFRLWIQMGNDYVLEGDHMCPSADWRKTRIRCMIMDRRTARVTLDRFVREHKITSLCISYVTSSRKRFWPLQCVAIYWPDGKKYEWGLIVLKTIALCGFGFVFGLLLYGIRHGVSRWRKAQKKIQERFVYNKGPQWDLFLC